MARRRRPPARSTRRAGDLPPPRTQASTHPSYPPKPNGADRCQLCSLAPLESHSSAPGAHEDGGDDDICAGYWELVEGENEARILDELGLGFVPPARRNFRFLAGRKRVSARAGRLDLGADMFVAKRGRPSRNLSESESAADPSGDGLGAVVVGAGAGPPEDIQVVDDVWVGTTKEA